MMRALLDCWTVVVGPRDGEKEDEIDHAMWDPAPRTPSVLLLYVPVDAMYFSLCSSASVQMFVGIKFGFTNGYSDD